jgi:hypothetical protein
VFLHLPVAHSKAVRTLFFTTALVTVGLMMWINTLRSSGDMHGLAPIFFILFAYFDFRATMWMLLILVALIFVPARPGMRRVLTWIGEHPMSIAIVTTGVMCAGALLVYRAHPLAMDEYAPLFQSQAFAAGHLTGQFPAGLLDWLIPRGFQDFFLNVSKASGAVASAYWPSFALLLTPFTWLGVPWACNPVLSGLTVIVMHRLALKLLGNVESAGLAVLLTIASPVFFADGISYYSMTAHMLFNGVFALLLLEPTPRRLMVAGVAGSIALTLHNPVPHMLFAAPWIVWLATREQGVQKLASLAAGYLPLCLLLGVGWFWLSSELIHQGVVAADAQADGLAKVSSAFALPSATVFLARAIGLAKVWLWAVPGLLILACMGGWKWRHDIHCRLLAASAIATLLGYLFVWADQGHGWGFRYFHSAWLVLPLLGAAALTPPPVPSDRTVATTDDEMNSFVVASALLMLVVGVSVRGAQIRDFMTDHLNQLPAYAGSEKRVMFLDAAHSFYGQDLVQNDPFLRGNMVRMLSAGPDQNAKLMSQLRPDFRKVYSDYHGEVWSAGPAAASGPALQVLPGHGPKVPDSSAEIAASRSARTTGQ